MEGNFSTNNQIVKRKKVKAGRTKTTTTVAINLYNQAVENHIPFSVAIDRGITEILQKSNTQQRLQELEMKNSKLTKSLQLHMGLVKELQMKVEKLQR